MQERRHTEATARAFETRNPSTTMIMRKSSVYRHFDVVSYSSNWCPWKSFYCLHWSDSVKHIHTGMTSTVASSNFYNRLIICYVCHYSATHISTLWLCNSTVDTMHVCKDVVSKCTYVGDTCRLGTKRNHSVWKASGTFRSPTAWRKGMHAYLSLWIQTLGH